jgi:hypothetical protein
MSIFNREKAEKIPFNPKWSGGAPLPHLLQSEYRAFLTYYINTTDPNWDGTYVTAKDPSSSEKDNIAVVEWKRCRGAMLGGLNDEAISGHRLYNKGLSKGGYDAFIVKNSKWIEELRKGNSVHSQHKDELFSKLNHYILLFHDTTFECLAESFEIEILNDSMPEVLKTVIAKLN